jgi:hypothetical protein
VLRAALGITAVLDLRGVPVDFSKLTGGQIALLTAIGAVLAALVAGSFALVVAWVNGMYAVRIARKNSQREFYLKAFKPYFDIVENDMFLLQQLVTRTTNLKSQSVAEGRQMMGDAHAQLKWHQVAGLAVLLYRSKSIRTAGAQLHDAMDAWQASRRRFRAFNEHEEDDVDWMATNAGRELQSDIRLASHAYYSAAIAFRTACEAYIFKSL